MNPKITYKCSSDSALAISNILLLELSYVTNFFNIDEFEYELEKNEKNCFMFALDNKNPKDIN